MFLRVENFADDGPDIELDADNARRFAAWKADTERGYFLLDSVNMARACHGAIADPTAAAGGYRSPRSALVVAI